MPVIVCGSNSEVTSCPSSRPGGTETADRGDPNAPSNCTAIDSAYPRLSAFRCLLNRRGVRAAPLLNGQAREAPHGPGSCLEQ
jgi:hypothetical protein